MSGLSWGQFLSIYFSFKWMTLFFCIPYNFLLLLKIEHLNATTLEISSSPSPAFAAMFYFDC